MDERTQAYIDATVAKAPPLTAEQRDRLAILLRAPDAPRVEAVGGVALTEMMGDR
jgi:hypothetical protein